MNSLQENATEIKTNDDPLASIVKRLGNHVSTLLLDSSCHLFSIPHLDGVIGYQLFENCAVVLGDPICLPENTSELTSAFQLQCKTNNWKIIYFLVSDAFAHWAINNGCSTLIQVGSGLILDPSSFQKKQKIRWKINQSLHQRVIINEYQHFDPVLEDQMKQAVEEWLQAKNGPQIFLGKVNPFANERKKRIFYASQDDKIIGLLALSRIDLFQGWVVNSFISLNSSVGISEHLMCSVCDVLAQENCHFLCLGAVSGEKLGEIVGLNGFSKYFIRFIFRIAKWRFHLDRKQIYLNKYHPMSVPTYILTSDKLSIRELISLKKALNVKLS